MAQEARAEPTAAAIRREALIASAAILIVLGAVKHLGAVVPFVHQHGFTIAAAFQLYIPLYLIGRRGISQQSLGLSLAHWRSELWVMLLLSLATVVPFAIGHHLWQTLVFQRTFTLRWPDGLWMNAATQLLVVALSEELFFRGYLLERMQRLWPAERRLFAVPFGKAIIVSSAVFALAHFVGEYRFDRLGPFFPALLFGLLRARRGTLVAAVGYHAFCNILGDVLWAFYRS